MKDLSGDISAYTVQPLVAHDHTVIVVHYDRAPAQSLSQIIQQVEKSYLLFCFKTFSFSLEIWATICFLDIYEKLINWWAGSFYLWMKILLVILEFWLFNALMLVSQVERSIRWIVEYAKQAKKKIWLSGLFYIYHT